MLKSLLFVAVLLAAVSAQNCKQSGCTAAEGPCCSQYGYCGNTAQYCDKTGGCVSGCWGGSDGGNNTKPTTGKQLHHAITFRYKQGVTQQQVDSVTKAYLALNTKAIRNGRKYVRIVGGTTTSTEGVADRFRNGFILSFDNDDDRQHFGCCEKAHQEFGNFMGQYVTPTGYNVGFDFREEGTAPWLTRQNSTNLFHHVITFRYKPETTQAQIDSVTRAYMDLNNKAIRNGKKYLNIVGGRTLSTEGVANNFRNGFILTFKSADDLDHFGCCEKAHQDFGDFMGQYVTDKDYNVGFDFQEQF